MKLTKESLVSACKEKPKSPDAVDSTLAAVTHVHLNERKLDDITAIKQCTKLQVVYLYNNQLNSLAGIESLRMLTHLYIQRNDIRSLDLLSDLVNLKKLNAGFNRISTISGLGKLVHVEEVAICPVGMRVAYSMLSCCSVANLLKKMRV